MNPAERMRLAIIEAQDAVDRMESLIGAVKFSTDPPPGVWLTIDEAAALGLFVRRRPVDPYLADALVAAEKKLRCSAGREPPDAS